MADEHEETHTLRRPIRAPFVWSPNEDEAKVLDRLIDAEPEITKWLESRRAWGIVMETLKKIALLLTALSGGFFVLREIIRSMAG